jgi:hypothetical protein
VKWNLLLCFWLTSRYFCRLITSYHHTHTCAYLHCGDRIKGRQLCLIMDRPLTFPPLVRVGCLYTHPAVRRASTKLTAGCTGNGYTATSRDEDQPTKPTKAEPQVAMSEPEGDSIGKLEAQKLCCTMCFVPTQCAIL